MAYECLFCGIKSDDKEEYTLIPYTYNGDQEDSGYFCLDDGFLLEVRTNYCLDCLISLKAGKGECDHHSDDQVVWKLDDDF